MEFVLSSNRYKYTIRFSLGIFKVANIKMTHLMIEEAGTIKYLNTYIYFWLFIVF